MSIHESVYREYVAMKMYKLECYSEGNVPIRWGCLRENIRKRFIGMADTMVEAWAVDEAQARVKREQPGK